MLPSTLGVRKKCQKDATGKCVKKKPIQGLREPGHATFQKVPMDIAAIDASLTKANS